MLPEKVLVIDLNKSTDYQRLLSGKPQTCGMRSGRVYLQAGDSCGQHSTNHREELLVFLDGDHRGERMLEYAGMILDSGDSKKVLVLDDIHWSKDMYRAWSRLVKRDEISLSIEMYNTGIVFIHFAVQKEHFKVNF